MLDSMTTIRIPTLLDSSPLKVPSYTNFPEPQTYNDLLQSSYVIQNVINSKPLNIYQLGRTLGQGQYGTVIKARSKMSNELVAIKRIRKKRNGTYGMNQIMRQIKFWKQSDNANIDFNTDETTMLMTLTRIKWEIYILNRINSSHYIVKFIHALDFRDSPDIWLVYEYCNLGELKWKKETMNETLEQWKIFMGSDEIPFSKESFIQKVLHDITYGLNFLKSNGIIHRDIKPSNILLDGNQKFCKISDFGCSIIEPSKSPFKSKFEKSDLSKCFDRELNKIVGTPAFIAPEICHLGSNEYELENTTIDGYKLDIWSFGITLYCLIFNDLPFYGKNEFDTYKKIINDSLVDKVNKSPLQELVVRRMLEKDPRQRVDIFELTKLVDKSNTKKMGTNTNHSLKKAWKKIWKFGSRGRSHTKSELDENHELEENKIDSTASISSKSTFDEPTQVGEFPEDFSMEQILSVDDINSRISNSEVSNVEPPIQSSNHAESNYEYSPTKTTVKLKSKLTQSRNIVNFKEYCNPDSNKSSETLDAIKQYLNFEPKFSS